MAEQQAAVDEQYTRPQGLYRHRDVNLEELRRLILDAKLAPCHVGSDELSHDLDECPICFLGYPSLNWMKCCKKGMCTECFLVVKGPATHSIECCPFCVTAGASVEYRGRRTAEEIMMDMEEDQKAIEAEIKAKGGKDDASAQPASSAPSTTEAGTEMHDHAASSAVDLSNEEEQRAIEEEIRRIQEQEAYAASLVDMDEQRMIEAEIQLRREEEAYYALLAGQIAALDDPAGASPAIPPNSSDNPSDNPPGSSGTGATSDAAAASAAAAASSEAEEVIDEDQVEASSSAALAVVNADPAPAAATAIA
ncbi:unnamed protein product [Closterium sp. Yama58-4]|nr:unnamed protein product [Closterium sp. Yama58-4]